MTITLRKLVVTGPNMTPAEVSFSRPLSVIWGGSDTGKSHIFECINFILGGETPPEQIPESKNYDTIRMELELSNGNYVVLERSINGRSFRKYAGHIEQISDKSSFETLKAKHKKGKQDTVSYMLLSNSDLSQKEIRTDKYGTKGELSFRDVVRLTLVDEERIITKTSPYLSGQYSNTTREKSVFGLVLNGVDDSAIESVEKSKDRNSRLNIEIHLLEDLTEERNDSLSSTITDASEVSSQLKKLNVEISEATKAVTVKQAEITNIEGRRQQAWLRLKPIQSRLMFIKTQLQRFTLLDDYYDSDLDRINALMEAENEFSELQETDCPVCGRAPDEEWSKVPIGITLEAFAASCRKETKKINSLKSDLNSTLNELRQEELDLVNQQNEIRKSLNIFDKQLNKSLSQQVRITREDLEQLIDKREKLVRAKTITESIQQLHHRLDISKTLVKTKYELPVFPDKVDVQSTIDFCTEIQTLLVEWKYPDATKVLYDPDKNDLVIGDRNRGSRGKGYRAFTFAAFTIGLMRYCLKNNLPHPGFVVLDTPLNPLKGKDEDPENFEKTNEEMKQAFYKTLAKNGQVGQVIILENTSPPMDVRETVECEHFTNNPSLPRQGFYPVPRASK